MTFTPRLAHSFAYLNGLQPWRTVFFVISGLTLIALMIALIWVLVSGALGYGIYAGSVRLDLRRFFRWTGVLILVVAAGILAGSLRALHEAGLWNSLQATAFDLSGVLPVDSSVGTLLAGFFGYSDRPAIGEVIVYLLFLAVTVYLFLADPRPTASAGSTTESKPSRA